MEKYHDEKRNKFSKFCPEGRAFMKKILPRHWAFKPKISVALRLALKDSNCSN